MTVLVAMSGGVDSSVAAALLCRTGEEVVGVTLKLWGGPADRGCCSVADVEDARRVADQLGIDHHVFNFAGEFDDAVVGPYVDAHRRGRTPNPCIECNRHLKFDLLYRRARALGFDRVATGHHARVLAGPHGPRLGRGADAAKDQSYVLYMLDRATLADTVFPVGDRSKTEVRALAAELGLRTAAKPDSQDVCFIGGTAGGRATFLGERIPLRPGRVVDGDGRPLGVVDAVELVTIGQRKGLGLAGGGRPRYVTAVDPVAATVTVGAAAELEVATVELTDLVHVDPQPPAGPVLAQCSAHGAAAPATLRGTTLRWERPRRAVAPGQAVVLYDVERPDQVLGGGLVRSPG